jgi:uncharacterized repeat protein (TIGR02543 family)
MKKGLHLTLAFLTLCALLFTGCGGDAGGGGVTQYTVTFDTNGGGEIEEQAVANGGLVSQPSNPAKTNNAFSGWYKESACTSPWNFNSDTVTADITLYAKWETVPDGSFLVSFNSNGGTIIPDQVIASGGLVTRPVITKPGVYFNGWYKEDVFTTKWNFTEDSVTAGTTLYAKWTETAPSTVTITFNPDNGNEVTSLSISYNASVPATYFGTGVNVPIKAGYRFTGWKNGTATITNTTKFPQDADLTAVWVWQVTVKFNKGSIQDTPVSGTAPADVVIDNNTTLGNNCPTPVLPPSLEEDWEFAGWFNNNQQYTGFDRINTTEAEFILTARWSEIDKNIYTQNPAIHPGNHFVEMYNNATKTVTANESFTIEGLFANVEAGAGTLSAKWYRATTENGEGTQVGAVQTAPSDTPHDISLKYTGTETAAGTFWYWVEVTNYNKNATDGYQYSTAVTQNRLKLIVVQ